MTDKGLKEEGTFDAEQLANPLLFGRSTPFRGGRKRGSVKQIKWKKPKKPPLLEGPLWRSALGISASPMSPQEKSQLLRGLLLKRGRQGQR